MKGFQYEELCRVFLAEKLGVAIGQIKSGFMPNPKFPDLPDFKHQIDLYWETGDDLALYLNIANAKWRADGKIDQGEVMLLQQVRTSVSAHKAMMITNTEFTSGAKAVAQHYGIALHVVRPSFDDTVLDIGERGTVQSQLEALSAKSEQPLYAHEVIYRAFDLAAQAEHSAHQGRKVAVVSSARERGSIVHKVVPTPVRPAREGGSSTEATIKRVITPRDTGRGGKPR